MKSQIILGMGEVMCILTLAGCGISTPMETTHPQTPLNEGQYNTSTLAPQNATSVLPFPTITTSPTPYPPVGALPTIGEKDGWTTYQNAVVGYEIGAPRDFILEGKYPEVGCDLLGPGVPCDAVQNLIRQYYGDSLCIGIGKAQTAWFFGIEAYDIVQNHLDGWCFGTGIGDYELINKEETITVDGQPQKLTTTILLRDQVQVGEISLLPLKNEEVRIMFGFSPAYPEKPGEYQDYVQNIRPELIRMIESFKSIPMPEVN